MYKIFTRKQIKISNNFVLGIESECYIFAARKWRDSSDG